jgi:PEP-CTERM motif
MRTRKIVLPIGAVLAALATTPALGVPIVFDITGRVGQRSTTDFATSPTPVIDLDAPGLAFSMQFEFEADSFGPGIFSDEATHRRLDFVTPASDAVWSGSFTYGGLTRDLSPFVQDNASVVFSDTRGGFVHPSGSMAIVADGAGVVLRSVGIDASGLNVSSRASFFGQQRVDFNNLDASHYTLVDLDQPIGLDSLLTLPFEQWSLTFDVVARNCDSQGCSLVSSEFIFFNVETLTRSVRSVPEPGALGLLALGLLGVAAARRRASTT